MIVNTIAARFASFGLDVEVRVEQYRRELLPRRPRIGACSVPATGSGQQRGRRGDRGPGRRQQTDVGAVHAHLRPAQDVRPVLEEVDHRGRIDHAARVGQRLRGGTLAQQLVLVLDPLRAAVVGRHPGPW
jgi:hypothetical protein